MHKINVIAKRGLVAVCNVELEVIAFAVALL